MSISRDDIFAELDKRGCRGAILPAECVGELEKEMSSRIKQGEIDCALDKYLGEFCYNPEEGLPGARSVFIMAAPILPTEVTFDWRGEVVSYVIPPTYVFHGLVDLNRSMRDMLTVNGNRVGRFRLPMKLLAARSGLGEYGRNNILYVPGMGSFLGLTGFYSDFPPLHELRKARLMESCKDCAACADSCPAGCIDAQKFVIRSNRCLTLHNEGEGEMPEWLNPSWHNALVGCMRCQEVCPENSGLVNRRAAGEHFTAAETGCLLEGTAVEGSLREKLDRLGITDYASSLSRNLRLLLEARR